MFKKRSWVKNLKQLLQLCIVSVTFAFQLNKTNLDAHSSDIIIVGAGPAGLAIAGRLRKRGIPFTILEASDKVASAWHNHYDRLHLHTVKQWSHLPHMPFPNDYPLYVPRQKLLEYFEGYQKHFSIEIKFNNKVKSIHKTADLKWKIVLQGNKELTASTVIIATGVNRVSNHPHFDGEENSSIHISHSKHYKNPKPYFGQKVLVVGMGNTGAEIALDLSEQDIETFVSVRGPVNIVPRDLNGRPVQVTAKKLAKLPFGLGIWLGTQIRKAYIGDLSKYGIESPKMSPTKQLLVTGKTPIVDIGTVAAIKAEKIKVYPEIEKLSENTVYFKDGRKQKVDSIILATGYKPKIEDFIEKGEDILDKYGCPTPPIGSGFHQNLYFLGFDNYKLGGILGIIMDESELIANHIESQLNTKQ